MKPPRVCQTSVHSVDCLTRFLVNEKNTKWNERCFLLIEHYQIVELGKCRHQIIFRFYDQMTYGHPRVTLYQSTRIFIPYNIYFNNCHTSIQISAQKRKKPFDFFGRLPKGQRYDLNRFSIHRLDLLSISSEESF